jgi:TonB-linked SusC/RagA family outer membrane protein
MLIKNVFFSLLSVCMLTFSVTAFAQSRIITGKINSEDGAPMVGVNVVQKGTTNGDVSDTNGNFKIQLVPGQEVLVFSFVGYQTIEKAVAGMSVVNVDMEIDADRLEEVIVVGYGSQEKSDITGAVSSVSSKDLEKAVFNSVDDVLQGRSPGVQVTSSSGEPGAPATIRIRGNNSISGSNAPLYVVDGIPIGGSPNFSPQDIESIEILKDASATAIYGSRGANGVILVSTKRGKLGKPVLQLNFNTSVSEVISTYDVLSGQQYAEFRNEANADLGREIPYVDPQQYAGQGFNWQDEILRTGIRNEYGLNVSGGQDNIKYFVSGNYLDDNGILEGSSFSRGNFRSNFDVKPLGDLLSLKINLNATHTVVNRGITSSRGFPASAGPIFNALTLSPIVPTRDFSGFTEEGLQFFNPYLEVTAKDDRNFITAFLGSTEATFNIAKTLTYTFNGGVDFANSTREIYVPSNVGSGINANGQASTNNSRGYDFIVSNYLTYKNKFSGIHDFNGTAGLEYSEFNNYANSSGTSNFGIEILGPDNIGIGTGDRNVNSSRNLSVLQSGFVRVNYGFNDRYLITATMRADGSSRFAENQKWGYFPSGAIGWRVSEENFLKGSDLVSNLKLRASYGETGSQSIAPYQSLARYGTTIYGIGNSPSLAYIPQSVANPNLKWETTKQLDLGFDLGIFKNKVNIVFDYFQKTTEDLLQAVQIPTQSGFGGALINFGSIENEGIELGIDVAAFTGNNFTWNSSFNFTSFKTTVLELGGDEEIFGPGLGENVFGNGHIYRPGDEFGMFYGFKAIGLIQESDFDAEGNITVPIRNNDNVLGHWKFEDIDGDGVITNEDRTIIGNPNPDYIFGWNNDFSYRNFSLNMFIQGSVGNDVYNTMGTVLYSGFNNNEGYKNQTVDWYENRWTPDNPTNDIRYPSINSFTPPVANYMVEDGSYVRLKNISLRYNLPIRNARISHLQFYVTGTNLFTLTDYTGFDPEVSSLGANTLAPGVDLGAYPRQKAYTFGMSVSF